MASSAIGEEVSRIGVADTTPISPPTKPVEERSFNVHGAPCRQLTPGMEAVYVFHLRMHYATPKQADLVGGL